MESEVVDYLIREHCNRLTGREQLVYKQLLHTKKLEAMGKMTSEEILWAALQRASRLPNNAEMLALLQTGIPAFRQQIAEKIYAEHGGEALLNKCPVCQRLARTSLARQCRHCGHDWH